MSTPAMTPPEHSHSAIVDEAARWLADNRASLTRPIVPTLRERFGITALQACEAAALSVRYQVLGR